MVKNNGDLLYKLEDQLNTILLLLLNKIREKHPILEGFDKSKNERDDSRTQTKDFDPNVLERIKVTKFNFTT